jgi:hypothetical protein
MLLRPVLDKPDTIPCCWKSLTGFDQGDVSLNFKKEFSIAAETLAAICMVAIMAVACGGGGGSTSGITQAYTAANGVGEVLRFSVNTANMTYSYALIDSPISGVSFTQTGTGALSGVNPVGTYAVLASSDGYIVGGKVFPVSNGVMVGNLALHYYNANPPVGAVTNIPVFSISNPITSLLGVDGVYNYQGFSCNATGIANVSGVPGCSSHLGTMLIAGSSSTEAIYADCNGGDITAASGCSTTPTTGRIVPSAGTAGVYDLRKAGIGHIGWFFAFTAPNGQVVGVIDHDDPITPAYGFAVLAPHTPVAIGASNGSYLVETNENQEQWVTISTTSTATSGITTTSTIYTSTAQSGVPGTLTPNLPWDGLSTYYLPASGVSPAVSGVAMVTGTGAYTHSSINDTRLFAVGVKYGP